MVRPTPYLSRMAIFVVIVAVTVAVLFVPVSQAFMANPALNGLIIGVLVIGIGHNFRQVLRLQHEIGWVESVRDPDPDEPPPRRRPVLLATLAAAFGEERGVRFSPVSMRSILDGVQSRVEEAGETARYLAGLLIFLGLIGTFWGLIQTVSAIADVIDGLQVSSGNMSDVFGDLKSGLDAPLAGMGTAFSSSLFGLSGALVLGFLDLQSSQASSRFVNELEEWLSSLTRLTSSGSGTVLEDAEHSVPAYIQALLETTAENLEGLRRIVARTEEGRHTIGRNLELLAERLGALADRTREEQIAINRMIEDQAETHALLRRLADGEQQVSMDIATRRHIANIDKSLALLREEARGGRAEIIEDLRAEIKLLARAMANQMRDGT